MYCIVLYVYTVENGGLLYVELIYTIHIGEIFSVCIFLVIHKS